MLYPSIDKLLDKLDSKYALVAVAANRARELRYTEQSYLNNPQSRKYVGIALEEIVEGHITVHDEKKSNIPAEK